MSVPGMSVVRAGEGPSHWLVGDTHTIKATAASTGGAFGLVEVSVPPGSGPPPHVHTREDESFYLLDGVLEVAAGGQVSLLRPGDFAFLPRGVPHWFTNPGVAAARALILVTPGGFERFFAEAGEPARPGEQAPPFHPDQAERLTELTRRYGGDLPALTT
ncbi:quercetin 2,3-dioxygenase [Pseudonocardia acaciae]|uniref:quercetin 2,3-dioxygenase n=1 Tax=Pseudonocardia acaciae TaxID=551276 RepID=UPI00048C64E8|nr:quercetin 2,3-dioxygenase [Pseudonocardia acaciae]